MSEQIVNVGLGARAYDVVIGPGLLENVGERLQGLLHRPKTVIIADKTVFAAQGARLEAGLKKADIVSEKIILPPGEATKDFDILKDVLAQLLDFGVDRGDAIIAFGGGVIGDLTGFAAAILRRGCRFVQIPTTLLAQVDSSVGGKTAINAPQGKNLIGAFHQPSLVLADITALETLSAREMRAGYAEVVKYGALGDATFFSWLEENSAAILAGDQTAQSQAVKHSVAMKAAIVEEDETEKGKRALLNLGHTFGHALEAAFGYSDTLLHGEAVAAGMGLAMDYSADRQLCSADDAARLKAHLHDVGLPAGLEDIPSAKTLTADQMLELMMQDKKVDAGDLSLILARGIGAAFIEKATDLGALKTFLSTKMA